MSFACLILGESGTGKTCSLRNIDPSKALLIQPIRKPLPFPAAGWTETGNERNIFVTPDPNTIVRVMEKTRKDIIIVDDFQYVLAAMFMNRRNEKGYDKFNDIGGAGYDIARTASELPPQKRVYVLSHTVTDDLGNTRIKTLGRMLDDKIVVEGMFTTVLRTQVENGRYMFSTHNSGSDTVKSPMGMFPEGLIDNDLAAVDARICEYYGIQTTPATEETNQ